ncbi:putative transcription factor [Truncatella angustata]|uniref:Probable endonuclease LCL3 n=1 Tax=Truncatella angustata TaxID=152316 RepID=A0A9P8RMI1_9PEZI|nr:putative transcription factor [Truncatella angustata]KAH6646948.1 putative transcription factor [Truncatella angustata]
MAAPKQFMANVKSVLSGDTLILTSPQNPTLERTFSLAYVDAPRLRKEGDEPFAFQSREFLRGQLVGKQVKCNVYYTIPTSGREYGIVQLQDGTDLPIDAVKAGWLKVREDAGRKEESEDLLAKIDDLKEAESQAKSEEKGVHGKGGSIEVQNDLGTPDFFNQWKGKTVDAVVERVLSGDRILCRLLLSDKKHLQVMTLIAGIRTPATERTNTSTGTSQPAEEFGNEARAYVEHRILQRNVKVDMVGVSPQGQLVGHVVHPRGSIAEFLLADGLARCNDFHSTMLGEKMAALRAAEKKAQIGKLRLHKNSNVKATDGGSSDMIVSRIHAADTIYVRTKEGQEKQVSLSSVRAPRAKEPSESPFRDEAKEFLRKKLIGKHVKVKIDGTKAASEGFEARDVATITQNGKNINLQLVEEGWGSVIRHRKDDTDRAENYDELLAAQEAAQSEKKGMWSGKASKAKTYTDASESVQRAKIQASTLQRQKKVPGIVDFVKSGSRFTVLIPREGVKITLVLAGIRAPRAPLRGEKGEPFGQEAYDFASRRCSQRDVEIDVYDVDKVGGFIGDLYLNRESFGKQLVEEGLAEVHQYSAEKSGNAAELNAAQKRAKEGRKGKWHDWDPSQDEDADEAAFEETSAEPAAQDKQSAQYKDVVVTNIDANGKLKIQIIGSGTAALETLMSEFKKFHLDSKNNKPLANPPKTGDVVAAKFSADGQWYRAKVRSNDRTAKVAEVVYIDYGNSEKIAWSSLRALDQAQFTTQRLKAQAVDAVLSYIQLPNGNYFDDAINFLADATDGRKLVASVDFADAKEGLSYVTLFDASSGSASFTDSLNREIVAEGLALIPNKLKAWERGTQSTEVLKKLREVESQAKSERRGMWEYGDITED